MIIGIKYGHMYAGFTYPSIMRAFKQHCLELLGEKKEDYKNFIKFIWGIKIGDFDALRKEIESVDRLLKEPSNIHLSEKSLVFLDKDEKEEYLKAKNSIHEFFVSSGSASFFIDVFIKRLQKAEADNEEYFSIGAMTVRPDMVDEYGWNYPTKIPEDIKKW